MRSKNGDGLMTLKEKLEKKQEALNSGNNHLHNSTPMHKAQITPQSSFEFNLNRGIKTTRTKKKGKIVLILTASLLVVLLGIVYIPQFFVSNDDNENQYVVTPDESKISIRNDYIKRCGDLDFDEDGLSNSVELSNKTDVYNVDSDRDGVLDCDDGNPTSEGEDLYNALLASGINMSSACQIKDVIMWADDEYSFAHGGAIAMPDGSYRFSNFNGWVKFNKGKYAYKYENGCHTLLNHNENANAWQVSDGDVVFLTDEKPEEVRLFKLFGLEFFTSENWLSDIFLMILPENGWVTCNKMWLEDTFINIHEYVINHPENVEYDVEDYCRFDANDNNLNNVSTVYKQIDQGITVLASLFSSEKGESVVAVYGYTSSGDLLVCDPNDTTNVGLIAIFPSCVKTLNSNNEISEREYYEFKGAGFDSSNGDTINFFSHSGEKDID